MLMDGRATVAQTLLSVLVRLGTPEICKRKAQSQRSRVDHTGSTRLAELDLQDAKARLAPQLVTPE
jgi:hypothetical protein